MWINAKDSMEEPNSCLVVCKPYLLHSALSTQETRIKDKWCPLCNTPPIKYSYNSLNSNLQIHDICLRGVQYKHLPYEFQVSAS